MTTVGDIIDGIRRPGGARWKPSGLRSASPMMLLTWMPVPGTTMPEPSPFVQVTEHARPAASTTEMCVVEPIREREQPRAEAGLAEALDELRRARGLRLLHRAHDDARAAAATASGRAAAATARAGSRRPTAAGSSARRGRGSDIAQRLARDRLVAREVLGGQRAAARADPVDDRRGDVAAVERRRRPRRRGARSCRRARGSETRSPSLSSGPPGA